MNSRTGKGLSTHVLCAGMAMLVVLGGGTGAAVIEPPASTTPVTLQPVVALEGITEYRLGNGLKVLFCPDPYKPTITVNMTYRFGSRHEGPGETGMVHMLEHLMGGGTQGFPSLHEALNRVGAEYNGSTWFDRVNFHETLLATDENLDLALHIEAERMVNATFGEEELDREKGVIENEFEMDENSPLSVLSQRMLATAFLWHAYGKTPMGNLSDIRGYPLASMRAFYERHCRPDNATLIVAGRFEPAVALRLISKRFGKIPRPEGTISDTYTAEPTQDGPRSVTLERSGDTMAAGLAYHVPAGSHPDSPAILLLGEILAAEHSGRLYRLLVDGGSAASVRANNDALNLAEPGVMQITAQAGAEQSAEALVDTMASAVETVGREGITEQELERARARQLLAFRRIVTDSDRLAVELSEWVALGDWRLFFVYRDGLRNATKADVDRVARTYLVASNRTAGLFVPESEPTRAVTPPGPALTTVLEAYGEKPRKEQSVAAPPTEGGWTRRVLHMKSSPGLNIGLLNKPTRGSTARLELRLRYGDDITLRGQKTAAGLLPELLGRGSKQHDHDELLHRFDLLQSEIRLGGHTGVISVSIESDREHLVPAIELAGEMLRRPAFDRKQFDMLKKERRTVLEAGLSSPVERCFNGIRRGLYVWPQDSVHYMPTLEEQIEELDNTSLEQVKRLYSDLVGAGYVTVSVVGEFDTGKILGALTKALEGWDSGHPYKRVSVPFKPTKKLNRRILTPDKAMAIVGVATLMDLRDDDPDYPALTIANHILGGSPSARLQQRLRYREGITYHTKSLAEVGAQDRSSAFFAYAFCSPDNVPAVHAAMREELLGWIGKGVTDSELAEAKTSYAREREIEIADDREIAREIVRSIEIDRSLSFRSALLQRIETLSTDEVNAALNRLLGDAQTVEIEAGDLD